MNTKVEAKAVMETITKSEIQTLISEGFNVRTQSNGLVFVGKKIKTQSMIMQGIAYGVVQEKVYRLAPEKNRTLS